MAGGMTRALGVDTALRCTGIAVVESRGGTLRAVEYGHIRNASSASVSECLLSLHQGIGEVVARTHPDAAVMEGVFFCRNVKTSITLGEARGAVIVACKSAGLLIYEYPPRRVKQAIVGVGGAEKDQVRRMVMSILGLTETPEEDAGDALALAICHLNRMTPYAALAPEPI